MTYEEAKAAYLQAWKDWYYWPVNDKEGQCKALGWLYQAGKVLNEVKAKESTS